MFVHMYCSRTNVYPFFHLICSLALLFFLQYSHRIAVDECIKAVSSFIAKVPTSPRPPPLLGG